MAQLHELVPTSAQCKATQKSGMKQGLEGQTRAQRQGDFADNSLYFTHNLWAQKWGSHQGHNLSFYEPTGHICHISIMDKSQNEWLPAGTQEGNQDILLSRWHVSIQGSLLSISSWRRIGHVLGNSEFWPLKLKSCECGAGFTVAEERSTRSPC
jgi:hypothetical protein